MWELRGCQEAELTEGYSYGGHLYILLIGCRSTGRIVDAYVDVLILNV